MMPFRPVSGGIPQPTTAQCAPFSFTLCITGAADGAAGGGRNMGKSMVTTAGGGKEYG